MRSVRVFSAAIIWIAVFSLAGRPTDTSAQSSPDALALTFIHLLVKNQTTWPKEISPGKQNPAKVVIIGDKRKEEAYRLIVKDDTKKSAPIEIINSKNLSAENLEGVHLVYFGEDSSREHYELLQKLDGKPILTVGVSKSFLDDGGMMQFRLKQETGKDRIHVNLKRITDSDLKVGAGFLRHTTVVKR